MQRPVPKATTTALRPNGLRALAQPGPALLAALILLTGLVFAPALEAPFHLDDHSLAGDPAVAHTAGWWRIAAGYVAPSLADVPPRTRPLTYATFWLQWRAGLLTPSASHAINIVLHLLNIWIAWCVVSRFADRSLALLAVAIFALHPVQTEPVVYVFARATLLSSTLGLAALAAWQRNRFALAAAALVAAIWAKEDAAAWIGVVFLYEAFAPPATEGQTGRKFLAVSAGVVAAVFAFWRVVSATAALDDTGALSDAGLSPLGYLAAQGMAIWSYAGLLTLWAGPNVDHPVPTAPPDSPLPWLGWIAVAAGLAAIVYFYRRSPVTWAALSACALLAPSSTILPLADTVAERRLYVPVLFATLAAVAMIAPPPSWLRPLWIRGALLAGLAGISFARVQVWTSELSLWQTTVTQSPDKMRPWLQLAGALEREEPARFDDRVQALERASELGPTDPAPSLLLGAAWLAAGDPAAAIQNFEGAALRGAPPAVCKANLGVALYLAGRTAEAQRLFLEALGHDSCQWDARNNLLYVNRSLPAGQQVPVPPLAPGRCLWTAQQEAALATAGQITPR